MAQRTEEPVRNGYYLEDYTFEVVTDHQCRRWLNELKNPSGTVGRWAVDLQQCDFSMRYSSGSMNNLADSLSRNPLPCGIETNEETFFRDSRRNFERPRILKEVHDAPKAGYLGITKSITRTASRYYYYPLNKQLRSEVTVFLSGPNARPSPAVIQVVNVIYIVLDPRRDLYVTMVRNLPVTNTEPPPKTGVLKSGLPLHIRSNRIQWNEPIVS
ncbi:hypothetical protein QE152_g37287 [Popillia japonica]|uniref:Uncharacterized protein n=1 Tax=Popillia japonica TaxID=7064 RepID=A0AAW1IAQ1_POPJA